MKLLRNKKGFTLIEMLIVIAIIGILSSIVLVGLGPVQRRGRDARRISDLKQVQNALELYFNKCGYYPGSVQAGAACTNFGGAPGDWSAVKSALVGSALGVNQIPSDPSGGRVYQYGVDTESGREGSGYVLAATLEDASNPAMKDSPSGPIHGITCGGSVYCVQF
ncbi:MAG: type II secretion system protein [Patescibacteria group bacterium]